MRQHFRLHGIDSIVDSAGLVDWNVGRAADHRSVHVARLHNIDISEHVARQICAADFERFERIFVMDRQNLREIKQIAPTNIHSSIQLLAATDIPDPYHGDAATFAQVFSMIESAVLGLVEQEVLRSG